MIFVHTCVIVTLLCLAISLMVRAWVCILPQEEFFYIFWH
jgi:hypothetical protein